MAFKADLLRKKLKEEGKTRKSLAQAMRKTERTVSRWLNGGNPPKAKDLDKIAQFLNCSPQDFDPSYVDEGVGVPIYARISVASHNAYEMMQLRYGVTQKAIIELAPVLFSIVAAHALKVPSDDIALCSEAHRRRISSMLWDEQYGGHDLDKRASATKKCFGLPAGELSQAQPRNLFYEAISRLSFGISDHVNTTIFTSPEAGEAPSATGFIPDVDMMVTLTGGDETLIEALAKGRIRLSTCWEAYQKSGSNTLSVFPDILHRELMRKDDEHQTELAAKREKSLVKLYAWRAFYEERHPDLAAEYDQIATTYCYEEGWAPKEYDDDFKEACWSDPYQELRFINEDLLPQYQRLRAEGKFTLSFNDPIYQRFQKLEAHRARVKVAFEELGK